MKLKFIQPILSEFFVSVSFRNQNISGNHISSVGLFKIVYFECNKNNFALTLTFLLQVLVTNPFLYKKL